MCDLEKVIDTAKSLPVNKETRVNFVAGRSMSYARPLFTLCNTKSWLILQTQNVGLGLNYIPHFLFIVLVGDFFKNDLPRADLYSMCHVLHDWNDEDCDRILQKRVRGCQTRWLIITYHLP